MIDMQNDKYSVLKRFFGYDTFRTGQEELTDSLLHGRDVLGIMPTGAGKSLCYQVPALIKRGVTLVVSPLISLMKDQVSALVQQGVSAAYINRSLTDAQYKKVLENASNGRYKIIYVAPERLASADFLNMCRCVEISMVAVDEAHCVSQWGHDFRPSYLDIAEFIARLRARPVIGAFTATATEAVKSDIVRILRLDDPIIVTTGFDRPNLYFSVLRPENKSAALLKLIDERKDRSGIVYCSTRKTVEQVCDMLNGKGYSATRYHAGLKDAERVKNQDDFVFDRKQIMVATNAFGMGIDKSDVRFVIHYNMPKNIESYYQEAGRAGRDGADADCILMYAKRDVQTCRYFIQNGEYNPDLTPEQYAAFRERDEERLKQMVFYCTTSDCLRGYMLDYFGDEHKSSCGNCSNCMSEFETVDVTVEAQKILSCIIKTGQHYGVKMITDVLRGIMSPKITGARLDKQSTYGIMRDVRPAEIRYIIEKLEAQEYIVSVGAGRPALRVTEMSYPILRGSATVKIKKPKQRKVFAGKAAAPAVDKDLFDALRAVRSEFAQKRGVPAFVIFSDAALADMCRRYPVTDEEFLSVSGVGMNKLEKYGKAFMSVIKRFKPDKNGKLPFFITAEQLERFEYSDEPVSVSVITAGINSCTHNDSRGKLKATDITEWLVSRKLLDIVEIGGRRYKLPTEEGEQLGLSLERRKNVGGENYDIVLYDRAAQEYVISHIEDML